MAAKNAIEGKIRSWWGAQSRLCPAAHGKQAPGTAAGEQTLGNRGACLTETQAHLSSLLMSRAYHVAQQSRYYLSVIFGRECLISFYRFMLFAPNSHWEMEIKMREGRECTWSYEKGTLYWARAFGKDMIISIFMSLWLLLLLNRIRDLSSLQCNVSVYLPSFASSESGGGEKNPSTV